MQFLSKQQNLRIDVKNKVHKATLAIYLITFTEPHTLTPTQPLPLFQLELSRSCPKSTELVRSCRDTSAAETDSNFKLRNLVKVAVGSARMAVKVV